VTAIQCKPLQTLQLFMSLLLQVLLKPGASFQLREFHSCVARVTAAAPSNAADGKTLGEQQQQQQQQE
jgi:hypothetical protein